jgi:hypothetical protein
MSETPGDDTPNSEAEPGYWEQQAQPPGQPPQPGYGYGYGYVSPGQPAYPPYAPHGYAPPAHREANKVLALGLIAVVGGMACYLPIFVAPFAWVIGNRVTKEIEAAGGQLGGRSEAQTGKILGIIGTCLLAVALVVTVVAIGLAVGGVFDDSGNSNV